MALDEDAAFQFLQLFGRWDAFDLHPILALMGEARVEKLLVQVRLIAQEQEAL